MPLQLVSAPRATVFAPVTVMFQTAMSPTPGTTLPDHDVVRLRLSVLLALTMADAWADRPLRTARAAARTSARFNRLGVFFVGWKRWDSIWFRVWVFINLDKYSKSPCAPVKPGTSGSN